jgi:hypothetical protein
MSDTVQSVIDRFVADLRSAMVADVAAALGGAKREKREVPVKARADDDGRRYRLSSEEARDEIYRCIDSGSATKRSEIIALTGVTLGQFTHAIGSLLAKGHVRIVGQRNLARYEVVR